MNRYLFNLLLLGTFLTTPLLAESPLSRVVRTRHYVEKLPPAHEYYDKMIESIQSKQWNYALQYSKAILNLYPDCSFASEATYYAGIACQERGELTYANDWFSKYLASYASLKHFEDAVKNKYEIALEFSGGVKKHVFDSHHMPKWQGARHDAITIFEEVISAFPRDELAAQSLFRKAKLQASLSDYDDAIDSYKTFVRRFPKHALTPEAYLGIVNTYVLKSKKLFPDPDFIELATISTEKFQRNYPTDERVHTAWEEIANLKDWFAKDLLTHARYWERKKKPDAADVYYKSIVIRYGGTPTAEIAKERLSHHAKQKAIAENTSKLPRRH
ncbi:MAG: outer membrane protein assembly factor BamD [Simkaniaceae bacterium]|nr:outer membrane protein assembly factor BamD [Simkaniaceae bacterium]